METITESYQQQKSRHEKEFGEFESIFFAFNNEQFKEGCEKLKVSPENKLVSIGMGGYVLKNNLPEFMALMKRHKKERKELQKNEKKLINAIVYELWNHEYCITGDPSDALDVLDMKRSDISDDLWKKIMKEYRERS